MKLEEMILLARNGVKMTHNYFMPTEYLTMRGNMIIFEDGVKIMFDDWIKDKLGFFNDGWSEFK